MRLIVSVGLFIVFFIQAMPAPAANVRRSERPIQGEYIVTLVDETRAEEVRRVALTLADAFDGDLIVTMNNGIKAFGVKMTSAAAERMARHPLVEMVEENGRAGVSYTEISLSSSDLWALDRIDQTGPVSSTPGTYKYTSDGTGVLAYVVDFGIQADHREFKIGDPTESCAADVGAAGSRVEIGANFADYHPGNDPCGGWTLTSTSNANHGTAVASILGGTYSGVAKGVTFVPVKVGSCDGSISDLGIAWGLDWILADHASRATNNEPPPPALVNMSLWISSGLCAGVPCIGAVEHNIQNVIGAGIPVIVSANNRLKDACGSGSATSPARLGYGNYSAGHLTGQVEVTFDSKMVAGSGTKFLTELSVGDLFTVGGAQFVVESIASDTSLTVVNWPTTSISWSVPTLTSPWRRAPHRTITVGGTMYDSARGDIAWDCVKEQCAINGDDVGSNFGRCVDIYAPAWQVQVASGTGVCDYRSGTLRNGTSYASPVVAGVVARLLGMYPSWSPSTIWDHLRYSATYVSEDLDGGPHTNHRLIYASPYQ